MVRNRIIAGDRFPEGFHLSGDMKVAASLRDAMVRSRATGLLAEDQK